MSLGVTPVRSQQKLSVDYNLSITPTSAGTPGPASQLRRGQEGRAMQELQDLNQDHMNSSQLARDQWTPPAKHTLQGHQPLSAMRVRSTRMLPDQPPPGNAVHQEVPHQGQFTMMSRFPSSAANSFDSSIPAGLRGDVAVGRRDDRDTVLQKSHHTSPRPGDARASRTPKWSRMNQNWNGRRNQGKNGLGANGPDIPRGVEAKLRLLSSSQPASSDPAVAGGLQPRSVSALSTLGSEKKPSLKESRSGPGVPSTRPKSTTPGLSAAAASSPSQGVNSSVLSQGGPGAAGVRGPGAVATKIRPPVAIINHEGAAAVSNLGGAASRRSNQAQSQASIIFHLESIGYSLQKMFQAALKTSATIHGAQNVLANSPVSFQHSSIQTQAQKDLEMRIFTDAFALENSLDPGRLHRWLDLDVTSDRLEKKDRDSVLQMANRVRGRSYQEQGKDDENQHHMLSVVSSFVSDVLLQRRSGSVVAESKAARQQHERTKTATGHEAQVTSSMLQAKHTTTSNQELFVGQGKSGDPKDPAPVGGGAVQGDVLRAQFRNQMAYDGLSLVDFCDIFALPVEKVRLWLHQGDQGRNPVERSAKAYIAQSNSLRQTFLEELNNHDTTAAEFCSNTQATPGDLASWLSGSRQYHRATVRAVWLFINNSRKEIERMNRPMQDMLQLVTLHSTEAGPNAGPIFDREELLPKMQKPTAGKHKMKPDAYCLEKVIAHRRGCAERVGEGTTHASTSLINILRDAHTHRSVVADKILVDEQEEQHARELKQRERPHHAAFGMKKVQPEDQSGNESCGVEKVAVSSPPRRPHGVDSVYAVGRRVEQKLKTERRVEADRVRRLLLQESTLQQQNEAHSVQEEEY